MTVTVQQIAVVTKTQLQHAIVTTGSQGPRGPGATEEISTDANNQLTRGIDGKLFVSPPQLSSAQW